MTSPFFDELERELRRATVRRAAAERAARVSFLRRIPVAAAIAAVLLVAVAAGGALVALRGESAPSPPTAPADGEPAAALRAELGVLRRQPRSGGRPDPRTMQGLLNTFFVLPNRVVIDGDPQRLGRPERPPVLHEPLLRRLASGRWGEVTLVPYRVRPGGEDVVSLAVRANARRGRSWAVGLMGSASAERLGREGVAGVAGMRGRWVVALLVPDGVAHVDLRLTEPRGGVSRERTASMAVRGNLALSVSAASTRPSLHDATWRDDRGRVLRVVRDVRSEQPLEAERPVSGALRATPPASGP